MKNVNKSLENWLNELNNFSFKNYEAKPDMDLYMEQILGYLDRELSIFKTSSLDKQITSSMINNYVKGEVIPSPNAKRYSKEHIALILEVCLLKKALSISNIKTILDSSFKDTDFNNTYNDFAKDSSKTLHKVADDTLESLKNVETNDQKALLDLALKLGLEANANMLIAERIMDLIRIHNTLKKDNE